MLAGQHEYDTVRTEIVKLAPGIVAYDQAFERGIEPGLLSPATVIKNDAAFARDADGDLLEVTVGVKAAADALLCAVDVVDPPDIERNGFSSAQFKRYETSSFVTQRLEVDPFKQCHEGMPAWCRLLMNIGGSVSSAARYFMTICSRESMLHLPSIKCSGMSSRDQRSPILVTVQKKREHTRAQ